jgi:hypothetical protein
MSKNSVKNQAYIGWKVATSVQSRTQSELQRIFENVLLKRVCAGISAP